MTEQLNSNALSTLAGVRLKQAGDVQDQGNATVTGNGRSGHAGRALQHLTEGLNNDLFLTHQLIDHKADILTADRDHNHMTGDHFLMVERHILDHPTSR
jgi:D-arabinose 5-phosphate isomerase GutQ